MGQMLANVGALGAPAGTGRLGAETDNVARRELGGYGNICNGA
jgi:hypothetical protein